MNLEKEFRRFKLSSTDEPGDSQSEARLTPGQWRRNSNFGQSFEGIESDSSSDLLDTCISSSDSDSTNSDSCSEVNKTLIKSAKSGDHEGVSRALKEGAEITYRDWRGDTGLHQGAKYGHGSVVKTFLEAGIDVNIRDGARGKWTALINAAYWDKISCLKVLLDNEADPDIKSAKDGRTALMFAALGNYPDIITELLLKGADMNILNNAGKNALKLAQENDSPDALKLLEFWGDQEALNLEMMTALRQGRGRLVSSLLRAGADLEATDDDRNTVMSKLNNLMKVAAKEGYAASIRVFIESGADAETGLDIAVKSGHRAAAEAFLDHGFTGYNREECLQQCDNNRERINEANKKLRSAAESSDIQQVEAALDEGAEINSLRFKRVCHRSHVVRTVNIFNA